MTDAHRDKERTAPYRPIGSEDLVLWLCALRTVPRTRPSCTLTFGTREVGRECQGFLVASPLPFKYAVSEFHFIAVTPKRKAAYLGTGIAPNLLASRAFT